MSFKSAILVASFIVLLVAGNALGGGGSGLKQMWLTSDRGTYIGSNTDPWLDESTIVSESPFKLDLTNHLPKDNIDGIYLIISASRDPRGPNGIKVTIGPANFSDHPGTTISKHLIGNNEWQQVSGNNGVTFLGYNTANHGILTSGRWYTIQRIDPANNGLFLLKNQQNHIYVDFEISSNNASDRIHIDSEGTRMEKGSEKGFTGNPYSHDLTWQIPEFSTVALPIAGIFAIMFVMHRRKKED
ncbi:Uncharacterised protein [uncultured archaeon]|nr:Uncharacterised protein [uncultured archaeon]